MKTQLYLFFKRKSSYDFALVCFWVLAIFLAWETKFKIFWMIKGICLTLILLIKKTYLGWGVIFLILIFLSNYLFKTKPLVANVDDYFEVQTKFKMGVLIKFQNQLVFVKTSLKIESGNLIYLKGIILPIVNQSDFDLLSYMRGYNVLNWIDPQKINIVNHQLTFHSFLLKYFEYQQKAIRTLGPLFLLGQKNDWSYHFYQNLVLLNVSHLFVISGLHIGILYRVLKKILISKIIAFILIIIYGYILQFNLSVMRSLLLIFMTFCSKRISFKNKIILVNLIFLLVNPWLVYRLGFIFGFVALFSLGIIYESKFKNKFFKKICYLIFPYLSTLPILILINQNFNLYGLFFMIFLTPIVLVIYFLSLFCWPFSFVLNYLYSFLIYLIDFLLTIKLLIKIDWIKLIFVQSYVLLLLVSIIINAQWNLFMEHKRIKLVKF